MISHGLSGVRLHDVVRATTINRMLYCSQVWWGFASKQELDSLSALVRKLVRLGFLPKSFPTFEELCKKADIDLFRNILTNTSHTLHDLLPLSIVLVMTCAHAHITVFSLDLIPLPGAASWLGCCTVRHLFSS